MIRPLRYDGDGGVRGDDPRSSGGRWWGRSGSVGLAGIVVDKVVERSETGEDGRAGAVVLPGQDPFSHWSVGADLDERAALIKVARGCIGYIVV